VSENTAKTPLAPTVTTTATTSERRTTTPSRILSVKLLCLVVS